ncbi:hypothetical protein [Vibrio aestuarianus]|uniref:hypothetical protein n=1 Tax=Vibrio aestuarianus TaxID=28171 RepID=UPI00237C7C36|nr:hypothetical protein [Vibrio aestuarianus]MDE1336211.1 hypothetical protein [Vibrio aestuarianus]
MAFSYFLNSYHPRVGGVNGSNSSNNGSESLNLENINVNYPSFVPIETQSIDVKSFVDLACVNQPHGLKMMMSIENGKLILITGKNKGLFRELKHKIRGRDALSHRYKATLDWPDNNTAFRKLWVDRQQRLCAEVFYNKKSHNVLLQLNPKQYDQNLMDNERQYSLPLSISINSLKQENSEYNLSSKLFEIQLKSGEKADVTFDKPCGNSVQLNVGGSTSSIKLPISRDEEIIDVKPCGECLQVAVSKTGSKKKNEFYTSILLRLLYMEAVLLSFLQVHQLLLRIIQTITVNILLMPIHLLVINIYISVIIFCHGITGLTVVSIESLVG